MAELPGLPGSRSASLPAVLSCWLWCAGLMWAPTATANAAEQVCDLSPHPASTPSARFTDHGDGTVTDNGPAQLMWMRCAVGQRWVQSRCEGQASRHSFAQAQAQAQALNDSGEYFFNDWRVPSLRELAMVSERQCSRPRINTQIFPSTPATTFWTSSASARQPQQAYVLDFDQAGVAQASRDEAHAVRLVRSAP